MQSIRTFGSAHLTFGVHSNIGIPKSELHRDKILELRRLGMNKQAISDRLGLTRRTVGYVIKKYQGGEIDFQKRNLVFTWNP